MERKIDAYLDEWASNPTASPLLIRGARRVGKTYALKRLGRHVFGEANFIYCDFQTNLQRLNEIFDGATDVERIVHDLSLQYDKPITPKTLIAFDEVQLCEKALNSLRFFAQSKYKVIATGSQLGMTLRDRSLPFPSDVTHIYLRPMDFEEFLWAMGEVRIADGIREAFALRRNLLLHEEALKLYREYIVLGGMPGVLATFSQAGSIGLTGALDSKNSIDNMDSISAPGSIDAMSAMAAMEDALAKQAEIIETYTADIALYAPPEEAVRVQAVWQSIPNQIARETSRKFQYSDVAKGGREKQYRAPLAWLEAAELVLLIEQTNSISAPLEARDNGAFFKVYMSDVGLLYRRLGLSEKAFLINNLRQALSARFRGALAENYIEQALVANSIHPMYWVPKNGTQAEVEFVIQDGLGRIIPIEVKSGQNTRSLSLRRYQEKSGSPVSIRFSEKNFGFENGIFSMPLYSAFCLDANSLLEL